MTSQELAAGKLEGSLELRDGPDSRRQTGLPLLQGLALCTLGGVRRWSARRGSAAVTPGGGTLRWVCAGGEGRGRKVFVCRVPAGKGFLV